LIAILGLVFALLRRRIKASSTEVRALKSDIDVLNERIISSDQSLLDFIKQQESAVLNTTQEKADHSLALKIADEVVRIENNLSRMDPSVRGYKQLSAALRRIKDNFAANGYELVDMLGKPYKEGMKVIANFVTDENLEEGQQIITSIIKPQINYDGVMIQAAQVTVSQNV
jgi:ribonucleotide monophosphatase NagD (HAD superfamily)